MRMSFCSKKRLKICRQNPLLCRYFDKMTATTRATGDVDRKDFGQPPHTLVFEVVRNLLDKLSNIVILRIYDAVETLFISPPCRNTIGT